VGERPEISDAIHVELRAYRRNASEKGLGGKVKKIRNEYQYIKGL
jgi:hypothetical protein